MLLPRTFAVLLSDVFHLAGGGTYDIDNIAMPILSTEFLDVPDDTPPLVKFHPTTDQRFPAHGVGMLERAFGHAAQVGEFFVKTPANTRLLCRYIFPPVDVWFDDWYGGERIPILIVDAHLDDLVRLRYDRMPDVHVNNVTVFRDELRHAAMAMDDAGIIRRRRRRLTPVPDEIPRLFYEPEPAPEPQRPPTQLVQLPERIALAIARDYIVAKEACPITQSSLEPGRIAVASCFCVFQAEGLEQWAGAGHIACPGCRSHLTYRVVSTLH